MFFPNLEIPNLIFLPVSLCGHHSKLTLFFWWSSYIIPYTALYCTYLILYPLSWILLWALNHRLVYSGLSCSVIYGKPKLSICTYCLIIDLFYNIRGTLIFWPLNYTLREAVRHGQQMPALFSSYATGLYVLFVHICNVCLGSCLGQANCPRVRRYFLRGWLVSVSLNW